MIEVGEVDAPRLSDARQEQLIRVNKRLSQGRRPWDWSDEEVAAALEALPETCALDAAVELSGPEIAELFGISHQAVNKHEQIALSKLSRSYSGRKLKGHLDE